MFFKLNRIWRGFRSIALMMPVLLVLPLAVNADDYTRLKGYWQCQEEGEQATLEFQSRQSLLYNGEASGYQLLPNNAIQFQGEYGPVDYHYSFQGDQLIILSPDGSMMYCRKVKKSAPPVKRSAPSRTQATAVPKYEKPKETLTGNESDPASLLYKFAGKWSHYTPHTETHIYLMPDGTYTDNYEAAYGGQFHDQGGYQTGSWGTTGTESGRGRWTVKGTLKRGQLTLIDTKGNRTVYSYQVHVKDGEIYWGEYFFNGGLYGVTYIYR